MLLQPQRSTDAKKALWDFYRCSRWCRATSHDHGRRRCQHRSHRRIKELIIFVVLRVASKVDSASLTTRLFCDAVIKCFNFGVDSFESTLTAHTVLAGCGGLTGRYCLEEMRDDDTAIIINSGTVHTVKRRSCAPKMRGSKR
jgi:hypothetical protein